MFDNWQAKETLTSVTVCVGFGVFIFSYFTLRINFYANARQHFMNAVYDLDKQMMSNPDLWTVFDQNDFALKPKPEAEWVAKRTAFIYYYFNLFETAYLNHRRSGVLAILRNQESYRTLDRRVRNFFKNSRAARTLWQKHRDFYEQSFQKYLDRIISEYS